MIPSMAEIGSARLLVVEDDASVRKLFVRMLRELGNVDAAEDGAEAVAFLEKHSYDAIVSDIAMPVMGGIEFLRKVREHDLDVPVILVTGAPGLDTALQ